MKLCLKNLLEFYKKNNYDNVLKLFIIFLNTINLFFFIGTSYCVPMTILLIFLYYKISKLPDKEKKITILTWLTFSIFTIFGESFIISLNSGSSLNYNNSDIYNVSSWLLSAYASMSLAIMFINDYYKTMLK